MTFEEVLDQAIDMVRRRGRVTYRTLQRQFNLDDAALEDLKDALLFANPHIADEDGRGLVWRGEEDTPSTPAYSSTHPAQPAVPPASQPTHATSPLAAYHTPEAERRQLTVMFCDLADSTTLSGQLDPEDLRDVIRAYQATSADLIERYEGYIAQYLGDGLLVYFGWPQAHEDDAQRAVHAGLGILEAMGQLNTRLEQDKGMRLAVRIGIHTGLVVVGEIGQGASQEHLALGEAPNIASRIEGIAEHDTVAISDTAYRLVQGYFVCEALGHYTLKGTDSPQQVYRVVRPSGMQGRFDVALTRGLTPIVGRESEVMLLLERWGQVRYGQGHAVFVSGEAGIGKSRLLQVLKDQVAGDAHTLWECRSSPYYANTALYPLTDLLQRLLQWQPDDGPHERLEKLERMLQSSRLSLAESVPLFATLLSLPLPEAQYPPLGLTPERQRQKTLQTMVAMVLEHAERQPVLFILEDLHWTDPSSLEWLTMLIDQVPLASVLTVLTCRPEFAPPWGLRAYLTPIALQRFTRLQIETMVTRVAGGKTVPTEVMQHVVEKSDGVPLYVEEMTKAILEAGVLQEMDGHYELTGQLTSLAIPTTLQDSLMARLDRLDTARSVAQLGGAIGRQFPYELLHAVSPLDEATLQRELRRLVEAELVYQWGTPPHATFTFKHALIQDAVYASLLKSTRQRVHQQIAQVLEAQFPETAETHPELLAHHYSEAGQNDAAIGYWQRALQGSAHVEAIHHLQQGIAMLTTLPETPARLQQELDLQVALGSALMAIKGYGSPDMERAYARARELCEQMGNPSQLFPILRGVLVYCLVQGQTRTATQIGEQLLHLVQSHTEPELLLVAHYSLGLVWFYRGEPSSAQTHHRQAVGIAIPQGDQPLIVRYGSDLRVSSRCHLAMELWQLGYPDQALQHRQATHTLVQEISHAYSLVQALFYTAVLHQYRREVRAVHEQAEALMILATEQGFAHWLARGRVFHGWALAMQGESGAGIAAMRQGLTAVLAMGDKLWQPYFLGLLAEAYGEGGHPDEGLDVLAEALAVMDTTEARFYGAELYRLKGTLLLKQAVPDASQAQACFHQALDIARNQQAKSWELRAAVSLARLWQRQGHRQEAYDLLDPVYAWFTEGFDTADLQEAKELLEELSQ